MIARAFDSVTYALGLVFAGVVIGVAMTPSPTLLHEQTQRDLGRCVDTLNTASILATSAQQRAEWMAEDLYGGPRVEHTRELRRQIREVQQ